MTYKGYTGALEIDEDSGGLCGIVLGTRDVITFVGKTVEEARQSLADSVECYLEHCAATGKEPDRPFTGKFQVRISSEAHRELEVLAHTWKVDPNDVVVEALDRFIAANRPIELKPTMPVKAKRATPAKAKPTQPVKAKPTQPAKAPKRRRTASKAV